MTHESDVTQDSQINPLYRNIIMLSLRHLNIYRLVYRKGLVYLSDRVEIGDKQRGLTLCDFDDRLPVIMVMGGSLGAKRINDALLRNLDQLCTKYQIIHLTGKGSP